MRNFRSLFSSLLEDFGKLLNASVLCPLLSFNASPLVLSGGEEARAQPLFWKHCSWSYSLTWHLFMEVQQLLLQGILLRSTSKWRKGGWAGWPVPEFCIPGKQLQSSPLYFPQQNIFYFTIHSFKKKKKKIIRCDLYHWRADHTLQEMSVLIFCSSLLKKCLSCLQEGLCTSMLFV